MLRAGEGASQPSALSQQWGMCQLSTRILRIPKPRDSHWITTTGTSIHSQLLDQGLGCEPGHLAACCESLN